MKKYEISITFTIKANSLADAFDRAREIMEDQYIPDAEDMYSEVLVKNDVE